MLNFERQQQNYLSMIENSLHLYLPEEGQGQDILFQAMAYSLENGGKRIRPILTLAFCEACGEDPHAALPFACAVEMIHTYSLIHDDLPAMDDDDLRRGRPSCHKAFDEATAILAGDALLTDAFGFMASTVKDIPAGRCLRRWRPSPPPPVPRHGRRADPRYGCTGKRTCRWKPCKRSMPSRPGPCSVWPASAAASSPGASESDIAGLRAYGEALGVTFQIVDDILDETSDTATLGKPAGSDAEMGKTTYPSLMGLDRSRELAQEFAEKAVESLSPFSGQDAAFLKGLALMLVTRKK